MSPELFQSDGHIRRETHEVIHS